MDFSKKKLLVKASVAYIPEIDWHKKIRFEIVGVYKDKHGNINFRQFEDVFY